MPSSTRWCRKPSRRLRATDLAVTFRELAGALAAVVGLATLTLGAAPRAAPGFVFSAPGVRAPAPASAEPGVEFLSDVRRDFRAAARAGSLGARARLAFAERALGVADVARGRERYEALRFAAQLDLGGDSAELMALRDRAIERVVREFLEEGDLLGEFVLRVLRDDDHDRAVRERVFATTGSDAVRAACLLAPHEAVLERALDSGEIAPEERSELLAALEEIARRFPAAKHPLSAKTWGTFCAEQARILRDLVLVGLPAPALEGQDAASRPLSLASFRGRVVLVVFWGQWCASCRPLHSRLRELRGQFPEQELVILGVNSDSDLATLRETVAREKLSWPNLWDGPQGAWGPLATGWRVKAWPEWILIDREGVVQRRWRGAPAAEECLALLRQCLSGAR